MPKLPTLGTANKSKNSYSQKINIDIDLETIISVLIWTETSQEAEELS